MSLLLLLISSTSISFLEICSNLRPELGNLTTKCQGPHQGTAQHRQRHHRRPQERALPSPFPFFAPPSTPTSLGLHLAFFRPVSHPYFFFFFRGLLICHELERGRGIKRMQLNVGAPVDDRVPVLPVAACCASPLARKEEPSRRGSSGRVGENLLPLLRG